jgi:type I restriction enzyme S subunit
MEYKRLGDYIREVNVRNRELKVTKLVGLTIDKAFIPSVANVIGTDLSNYKVIQREQFACSLMQVSRDGKMPVAMFEDDEAIMSPAYPMFEVIDKTVLMPQYLMMWFSRSEFDREASYYAVGGVRGSLTWEDFCNMRLPVPSITRQREIVSEYETLTNRIRLNEQMIAKLEETAQALYRKMFVDGIDKENLPEGWRMSNLKSITEQTIGGDWGKEQPEGNYTHKVLCIRGADIPSINNCRHGFIPVRYILSKNLQSRKLFQGDIVVEISGGTPTQSTGRSAQMNAIADSYYGCDLICSNFCRVVRPVNPYADFYYATFTNLYRHDVFFKYENSTNGLKNLDLDAVLTEEKITIPPEMTALCFSEQITTINNNIYYFGQELDKLTELQSLLLARMGKL